MTSCSALQTVDAFNAHQEHIKTSIAQSQVNDLFVRGGQSLRERFLFLGLLRRPVTLFPLHDFNLSLEEHELVLRHTLIQPINALNEVKRKETYLHLGELAALVAFSSHLRLDVDLVFVHACTLPLVLIAQKLAGVGSIQTLRGGRDDFLGL